jgi:hypothetical protein
MAAQEIKIGDTAFSAVFVQSFATEKDFLSATIGGHYHDLSDKEKKANLKEVYRIGQKILKSETPEIKE